MTSKKEKVTTNQKLTKNKKQKEEKKMSPIMENDAIDFGDAEDFKLPSDGYHLGNLANVEMVATKKNPDKSQFVLTVNLAPDDPDAPNLPMRLYLGWPLPEEKEVFWGSRTAYGAQIKSLKDAMTAFGGQESGGINKNAVLAFLSSKIGMVVKVKVKQSVYKDIDGNEEIDDATGGKRMQANIASLLPA